MSYTDRPLVCRDCGSTFTFTAGEQAFYVTRGLQNEPGRCLECRNARRGGGGNAAAAGAAAALGDGYVHYGPFASFGGRNPRQMHPATCARCNQLTEVPFVPRGERPVYCSECFSVMREELAAEAKHAAVDGVARSQ